MESLLKTDSYAKRCYIWEAIAFPDSPHLSPDLCRALVAQVHSDVIRCVGDGAAHPAPEVRFDIRRDGSAAGKWGLMRFNAHGATLETVAHEIGHSLTWNGRALYEHAMTRAVGERLKGIQHHLDFVLDNAGHGAKFVSCLLALVARYGGTDLREPLRLATQGFSYSVRRKDGSIVRRTGVTLPVCQVTLDYWTRVLCR